MELKNSVVFITGSADRIGKEIALSLARKGTRPVLHYYTGKEKAQKTAEEIAEIAQRPLIVHGDLTHPENWLKIKDEIIAAHGRVDVLVNNAAVFYRTPLFDVSEGQWDHFQNVNLKSVFFGCKIFGELMLKQKQGKIINIADVAAGLGWGNYIPYSVSKAGVIALTKGMAKALAPYVAVNVVVPGIVLPAEAFDENLEQRLKRKIPLDRFGAPEDVANAVAFLIEGGDYITGAEITIDGGRTL